MAQSAAVVALFVLLTLASIHVQVAARILLSDRHVGVNAREDSASEEIVGGFPKVEKRIGAVPTGSTTDAELVEREHDSMSPTRSNSEKFEFQAEVSRLMDIIINSLYSNKDVFLRELISNASDALDKIRFLSLMDKSLLGEGDVAQLDIHIKLDKEKNILSIRDRGIGMTKEDLIKNLGTIAKSGTSSFVDQMNKGDDLNLIGQFGVGFYSVYLIADYVEVISKHNDDKQYIWESSADGNFAISEDTENEPLGRGTDIRIHLKESAAEYATEEKLRELVQRYSQFISFPIYLWASKEVADEVIEVDEDEPAAAEDDLTNEKGTTGEESEDSGTEETDGTDDEPNPEEGPEGKSVKRVEWYWELLNDMKAIWLRNPKEVTSEEYISFYRSLAKDFGDDKPLAWTHFNAEGDVEFKSVLFVPPKASPDLFDKYYTNAPQLKLYIRRIFISDEIEDLLPKYLAFLKGIVDSDTLPLNVSREMLQQHSSLKTIKKKLIRKALDMIKRIMDDDPDEIISEDEDGLDEEVEEQTNDKKGKYAEFWKQYGKFIKMGILDDTTNGKRLAKLLRFQSSKSGEKLISFDQYVARMKPGQSYIYYITGQDKNQLENSPLLEKLLKEDYEVIYFTDPLDEYVMQHMTEYEDKRLQDASKENLKIGGKDSKAKTKELAKSYKNLTKWWKDLLAGESLESVKVSTRLADTPTVVVTSKTGWSSNMERVMLSQTLVDPSKIAHMKNKRILEINPRHPIIQELRQKVEEDPKDDVAKQAATLLYETALLESGFTLESPKTFASRIHSVIKSNLNVDPDAQVEEEVDEIDKDGDTGLDDKEKNKLDLHEEGHGISDPEPVDLLTEHLEDKEANEASGIDNANHARSGFMGDGDEEAQVFKQAEQHSNLDRMQSVKDEL